MRLKGMLRILATFAETQEIRKKGYMKIIKLYLDIEKNISDSSREKNVAFMA